MPLERVHAYQLVRILRVTIPVVVIVLISVFVWQLRIGPGRDSQAPTSSPRLVENMSELAEEIRFSQSEGGRTAFTVEARSNLGFSDGRNLLEDVTVVIYGEAGSTPDRRIHGDRCGYDERSKDIECAGNIELQLDPDTSAWSQAVIYNHAARRITTADETRIVRPKTFEGRANALTLFVDENVLEVRGQVNVVMPDGSILETERARYDQNGDSIDVSGGFRMRGPDSRVSGTRGALQFSPGSMNPSEVRVWGNVIAELSVAQDDLTVSAAELSAEVSGGRVFQARASGQAALVSRRGELMRTMRGGRLDAGFDSSGRLEAIEANDAAETELEGGERLASAWIRNEVDGSVYTGNQSLLQMGDYRLAGSHFVIQRGDLIQFQTDRPISIEMPEGATRSLSTEASFDPATGAVVSLVHVGNVEFAQGGRVGKADRAELRSGGSQVRLLGRASVKYDALQIDAVRIDLDQQQASFVASGAVRTLWSAGDEPVLVLSERAAGNDQRVSFSDGAELWSGNTYVKAATIDFEPTRRYFVALGEVVSTFEEIRFWSDRMEFDDQARTLHHSGNVRVISDAIEMTADDLRMTFDQDAPDEVLATGSVDVRGAGFDGQGDRAIYVRSSESIVLTGNPAEIEDAVNGAVRGCQLTFQIESRDATVEGDQCRVVTRRVMD